MRHRRVAFSPEARDDLQALMEWIAEAVGPNVALGYLARIERFCLALDVGGERGTRRDDIRPGLRVIGFERRVAIAFTVEDDRVTIFRLFSGGRDWESELS